MGERACNLRSPQGPGTGAGDIASRLAKDFGYQTMDTCVEVNHEVCRKVRNLSQNSIAMEQCAKSALTGCRCIPKLTLEFGGRFVPGRFTDEEADLA